MKSRDFKQVDVFTDTPYWGNPVAVVSGADDLSSQEMQRFAQWTNLSETTFLLPPTHSEADYRVRIFTTGSEMPFAGHPTIGSCHAWLEAGGRPKTAGYVVQECGVGLVKLRNSQGRLAFAAPPLIRDGEVAAGDIQRVCNVLQIDSTEIVAAQWADNGPGWIAVMLKDAESVLAIEPDLSADEPYALGVVGPYPTDTEGEVPAGHAAVEVRAFFRTGGAAAEDPVTGSLNAALAQWLLRDKHLCSPYIASQGTVMGRAGRVFVEEADGEVWIGGDAITCINGSVHL